MTHNPSHDPMPCVPVSWGELIDKLTILEIKSERIVAAAAVVNIFKELSFLRVIAQPVLDNDQTTAKLSSRLRILNETLWNVEENIRAKEMAGQFDKEFVELARSIYKHNDERGELKRQINLQLGSELSEEKSYRLSGQ